MHFSLYQPQQKSVKIPWIILRLKQSGTQPALMGCLQRKMRPVLLTTPALRGTLGHVPAVQWVQHCSLVTCCILLQSPAARSRAPADHPGARGAGEGVLPYIIQIQCVMMAGPGRRVSLPAAVVTER